MKKFTTILMALCLLFVMSGTALAADDPNSLPGEKRTKVKELKELRESNAKVFLLSDGTYEWIGGVEPIHYLDSKNEYQDISSMIIPEIKRAKDGNYQFRNEANCYTARFGDNTPDSFPVIVERGTSSVAFRPVNANTVSAQQVYKVDKNILKDRIDINNSIIYRNIYEAVDFIYESRSTGIKEFIVLNQKTNVSSLTFDLSMTNLTPRQDGDIIFFENKDKEDIFTIQDLYAVDSNGLVSNDIDCHLMSTKSGYQLQIGLDEDFLSSSETKYPVIIDPSTMVTGANLTFDTYASYRYPNSNYYLENYLRTGSDSEYSTRRSFIRFSLPTIIPADYVNAAYLRIEKYSGATPKVTAYEASYRIEPSAITWKEAPQPTGAASTVSAADGGNWYRMNALTAVKKWLGNPASNNGFVLKDATETGTTQWTTFYSSDAPSPHKPELHIEFSRYTGRAYWNDPANGLHNCATYALNHGTTLDIGNFGIKTSDLYGYSASITRCWSYAKTCVDNWLTTNKNGYYGPLSAYNAYIASGKWRVVLRIGYSDRNNNGIIDINNENSNMDYFDYHWWYETDTGKWAEKQGSSASQYVKNGNTNAYTNPASITWDGNYTSTCAYYVISFQE